MPLIAITSAFEFKIKLRGLITRLICNCRVLGLIQLDLIALLEHRGILKFCEDPRFKLCFAPKLIFVRYLVNIIAHFFIWLVSSLGDNVNTLRIRIIDKDSLAWNHEGLEILICTNIVGHLVVFLLSVRFCLCLRH